MYLQFLEYLQHYSVIHNFCDLCPIKIFIFVQEIAYIPKKRQWYCWQGIMLVACGLCCACWQSDIVETTLDCCAPWETRKNVWYHWVLSMFTIWFPCQNVLLFWVFGNLLTQTPVTMIGVTFWSWEIETQDKFLMSEFR